MEPRESTDGVDRLSDGLRLQGSAAGIDGVATDLAGADGRWTTWITDRVGGILFWSGIVLPVLYLPLLLGGIDTPEALLLFAGLFAAHVLALVGGRSHRRVFGP